MERGARRIAGGAPPAIARAGWVACAVLGAAHAATFLAVALLRRGYPYDIEWMEGGQLVHSYEILAGRFPYRAPSADHIAYPYQPLYSAVVAAFGAVFGLSLPLARSVSIASTLALAALVGVAVWQETRSRRHALLAGAAVLSLYGVTGFWFDLARVDSMFMALLVGGLLAARAIESAWGATLVSALLLVLAYKTKQLALPFFALVPPVLWTKKRAASLAFVPLVLLPLAIDHAASQYASNGWFSFYVNDVPRAQPYELPLFFRLASIVVADVPVILVLALAGCDDALRRGSLAARARQTWALAALLGAVATAAAWARPGGAANNLMTTYVLALVPAFAGWRRIEARGRPWEGALAAVAVALQLAWLGYWPPRQIPTTADYEAGRDVVALLRAAPGPVLVPDHPWLAVLAGKTPSYQSNAYWEMSFLGRPDLVPDNLRQRLRNGEYALFVGGVDPHRVASSERWWPRELLDHYRCDRTLALPGRGLAPLTGRIAPGPHVLCTFVGGTP